uniref:Secreted protein n=1 Tax=Apteryx owenii TaxID=8824 RepID=A0A8B9Q8K9_APTOW
MLWSSCRQLFWDKAVQAVVRQFSSFYMGWLLLWVQTGHRGQTCCVQPLLFLNVTSHQMHSVSKNVKTLQELFSPSKSIPWHACLHDCLDTQAKSVGLVT